MERLAAEGGDVRRQTRVGRRRAATTVGPVADDGGAEMGEVDPDLVRASRAEGGLEQRERGRAR